jgi:hypothetical protein
MSRVVALGSTHIYKSSESGGHQNTDLEVFRTWAYIHISGSDLYLGLLTSGGHQNLGFQISGGHQNLGLQISRGSGPHNLAQRYLEVNRTWAYKYPEVFRS